MVVTLVGVEVSGTENEQKFIQQRVCSPNINSRVESRLMSGSQVDNLDGPRSTPLRLPYAPLAYRHMPPPRRRIKFQQSIRQQPIKLCDVLADSVPYAWWKRPRNMLRSRTTAPYLSLSLGATVIGTRLSPWSAVAADPPGCTLPSPSVLGRIEEEE